MTTAARLVDAAIREYQRRLSPRKGWACAHRVAHGGSSCSQAVRDIVRDAGLVRGARPIVARFAACYVAAQVLAQTSDVRGVCCCGPIPIPFRF